MKTFLIVFVSFISIYSTSWAMVGGNISSQSDYPSTIRLLVGSPMSGYDLCTGVKIGNDSFLTSFHCLLMYLRHDRALLDVSDKNSKSEEIVFDETYNLSTDEMNISDVENPYVVRNSYHQTKVLDMVIVKVKPNQTFEKIPTAKITNTQMHQFSELLFGGFGLTKKKNSSKDRIRCVNEKLLKMESGNVDSLLDFTVIVNQKKNKGYIYEGDSGGPVYVADTFGTKSVVAINIGAAEKKHHATKQLFLRVDTPFIANWIESVILGKVPATYKY